MILINEQLVIELSQQAKKNPRLRQNFNLHTNLTDSCHRLLNAMEPGSYIPPHRHSDPQKQEGFIGIRGRMAVFTFDEGGTCKDAMVFGPNEPVFGVDIPVGEWHTVISLETGSLFYEVKAGPYFPVPKEDIAPWAPLPDSADSLNYLEKLEKLVKL